METWKGNRLNHAHCFHCGSNFRPARSKDGITLCNCKSISKTTVDLNRFLSGFSEDRAKELYSAYCKQKTSKWKPNNCDTGSLAANIARHGDRHGHEKYARMVETKNTTNISYFMRKTNGDVIEAKRLQNDRQAVGTIEKYIKKHGLEEGIKRWADRNKKWSETMNLKRILQHESSLPVELKLGRDRKLQYVYCVGILTNLSDRLFGHLIPESNDSRISLRHLDHQFSRSAAYHLNSDIKKVSSFVNLKWLSKSENLAKKDICAFSCAELTEKYAKWMEQNNDAQFYDDVCEALRHHWQSEGMQV